MAGALQVDGVRLYPLENSRRHHTDRFEMVHAEKPSVILRRGQEFDLMVMFRDRNYDVVRDTLQIVFTYGELAVTHASIGYMLVCDLVVMFRDRNYDVVRDTLQIVFTYGLTHPLASMLVCDLVVMFRDRNYDVVRDTLQIVFTYGPKPDPLLGTGKVTLTGSTTYHKEAWDVRLVTKDTKSIKLEVRSPPQAAVGEWRLRIETKLKTNPRAKPNVFHYPENIYLLFNPWHKGDLVYMEDKRLLDEYVLNDLGKIWVGPYGTCRGREWVFGQFDDCVLPAAMMMLDRAMGSAPVSRADPIRVTRALSRIVNSNDEDAAMSGVLAGNWSGEYEDGTAPAAWTGSVGILEEYLTTGQEVKYGQCWVFAGVLTTVCRALGIPSRVVSNLVSAHDANVSLTVDRYYDVENEELPFNPFYEGDDSIWNYHVWNEAWMVRPDLPKGYGGWQAIDATPQETSDGFFQCGPTSVEAIKCGAVGFNYDVPFMLASVNADLIRWKVDPDSDQSYTKIYTNKYHIGKMIYTKHPWIFDPNGDTDREDVTRNYKAEEGTPMERLSLMNAVRNLTRAKEVFEIPSVSREDMVFELVDLEKIKIGEDFSVVVNIENKSSEVRKVKAALSAASVFYTGIKANVVKSASNTFKIQPNNKEQLKLRVKADEYLDKLVEYCLMKIYAIVSVEETNETWADEDDFEVMKPKLNIQVDKEIPVNVPVTVVFSFTNPLKKELEKCFFKYESPGVSKPQTFPYRNISAGETVMVQHSFTPKVAGEMKLVGSFASRQLVDVTGSAVVEVY
ncbi:hemocyte protein-glutamine gamma-glutamyltransferase-like [Bacillus rossius redtenbacheri]|uniref:hemocyte protein-glutamine gamma-glutamyltransferase-like n=1 Tax=Bacillus rossius redtenbacheri TaxID=93214 RepID=UPI002FDEB3FE